MNDISWCISYLKQYNGIKEDIDLPEDKALRALMNITLPVSLSEEFYKRQDKALSEITKNKKIVDVMKLDDIKDRISLSFKAPASVFSFRHKSRAKTDSKANVRPRSALTEGRPFSASKTVSKRICPFKNSSASGIPAKTDKAAAIVHSS